MLRHKMLRVSFELILSCKNLRFVNLRKFDLIYWNWRQNSIFDLLESMKWWMLLNESTITLSWFNFKAINSNQETFYLINDIQINFILHWSQNRVTCLPIMSKALHVLYRNMCQLVAWTDSVPEIKLTWIKGNRGNKKASNNKQSLTSCIYAYQYSNNLIYENLWKN